MGLHRRRTPHTSTLNLSTPPNTALQKHTHSVYLWGFTDAAHWINGAGIFDADLQPKPAADALRALWEERWTTSLDKKGAQLPGGKLSLEGYYGAYDYEVKVGGKTHTGSVQLTKGKPSAEVTLGNPTPTQSISIAGRR